MRWSEKVAAAEAALRQPFRADDPNLEVVHEPGKPMIVPVQMNPELTLRLFAEVERRGVSPNQLIVEYIDACLDATDREKGS